MKISISLPDDDVAVLDEYARQMGLPSRSAAVQRAIHLLKSAEVEADYAAAWDEWVESGAEADWDVTTGDVLIDVAR